MISNEAPKENLLSKEAIMEEEKRIKESYHREGRKDRRASKKDNYKENN
jgi:hypothetical protein